MIDFHTFSKLTEVFKILIINILIICIDISYYNIFIKDLWVF